MTKGRPKENVYPKMKLPTYFKGAIFSHLKRHKKVEIIGFGTFEIVKIKPRKMYHNFSGEERTLKGYRKLKFTQSIALKKQIS